MLLLKDIVLVERYEINCKNNGYLHIWFHLASNCNYVIVYMYFTYGISDHWG